MVAQSAKGAVLLAPECFGRPPSPPSPLATATSFAAPARASTSDAPTSLPSSARRPSSAGSSLQQWSAGASVSTTSSSPPPPQPWQRCATTGPQRYQRSPRSAVPPTPALQAPSVESSSEAEVLSAHIRALRWEITRAEEDLVESQAEAQAVRSAAQVHAERQETLRGEVAAQDCDWNAETALQREELERQRCVAAYGAEVDQLQTELLATVEARSWSEVRLSKLAAAVSAAREYQTKEQLALSNSALRPPSPLRPVVPSTPPVRPRLSSAELMKAGLAAAACPVRRPT